MHFWEQNVTHYQTHHVVQYECNTTWYFLDIWKSNAKYSPYYAIFPPLYNIYHIVQYWRLGSPHCAISTTLCNIYHIMKYSPYFAISTTLRKITILCNIHHIWLILPRSSPPLEICRWFPQIVFILPTHLRPINVGFSNRFFCLSDKRFLNIIIKKKFEEDKS